MPNPPDESPDVRPVVHVLVSEPFFRDRVVDTLRALVLEPMVGDWELDQEAFIEAVASTPAQGVVLDLEEKEGDAMAVLRALREDERTADWHWLTFCSHEEEELVEDSARLGIAAVPRSTFASTLVRLLQAFHDQAEDPA